MRKIPAQTAKVQVITAQIAYKRLESDFVIIQFLTRFLCSFLASDTRGWEPLVYKIGK